MLLTASVLIAAGLLIAATAVTMNTQHKEPVRIPVEKQQPYRRK